MITDEWHIESHKKYLRDNKGENHAYKWVEENSLW
jgi:hypothetical protein